MTLQSGRDRVTRWVRQGGESTDGKEKGDTGLLQLPPGNCGPAKGEAGPTGERREAMLWGSAGKGPSRLTSSAPQPGHSLCLQQLTEVLVTIVISVQPGHSQDCGPDAWLHDLQESNDSDQQTVLSILPAPSLLPTPFFVASGF